MALRQSGGLDTNLDDVEHREDALPELSTAGRAQVLALAAAGPLITGYAAVAAVLATVTAIAPRGHFDTVGALSVGVPGWLAAHQVPVAIGGHELGALPLVPSIGLMVLVARTAAGAADRMDHYLPRHGGQIIITVATAHGIFGLALALVSEHGPARAAALAGFVYPALLAALAATAGVAGRCGMLAALLDRVDGPAVAGLRTGLLAVAMLLAAGAVVLVVALLGSVSAVASTFAFGAPGFGAGLGMLLLSAGYLPNAVVGAASFVAGPGFSLGGIAVGSVRFAGGPLPAFPLLAAVPDRYALWWPVLCVVPLGVGLLVGWLLRDVDDDPVTRLRAVAVAAVVAALCCVVASVVAGGKVGDGPLDPLNMRAVLLSVSMLGWIAIPGGLVAWYCGARPEPREPVGLIDFDDADDPDGADNPYDADSTREPEPHDRDLGDVDPAEPAALDEPADGAEGSTDVDDAAGGAVDQERSGHQDQDSDPR